MTRRRLLVVTYPYPPMPSVGGNRWLAIAKYLRRLGHEVTVLTTSAFGDRPEDREEGVVRSKDLVAAGWLRRVMRRPPLPEPGAPAGVDRPPSALITSVVVPDPYAVTWVPYATLAARRLVAERAIDCVITTSAYESTHLVALGLGRRRPAWIADFRDGWTFHPWKPAYPTRPQQALDRWLEARAVRTADRVTVVQRPVGEDFRSRLGIDPAYVPNGWDPDLSLEAEASTVPELDPGRVHVVYTGRLSGGWGRDPGPLFAAMEEIRDEPAGKRLRLVIAGRLDSDEEAMIRRAGLGEMVVHLGELTRAEAMALQRRADALLMLTSPDLVWELPGKVFEYFGAGRPILALAEGNEAARVITETSTGHMVAPRDVEGIAKALRALGEGELFKDYDPRGLEPFTYPEPAERIAREVEPAIESRARRAR